MGVEGVEGVEDPEFVLRAGLGRDYIDGHGNSISSSDGGGRVPEPAEGTYSSVRTNSPL